jgi:hypothetical protein
VVERLLRVPDAITAVKGSTVTGNILITYDTTAATEQEVQEFVVGVFRLYQRNRAKLHQVGLGGLPAMATGLEATLRSALRRRLVLDTTVEIPDDIVA